MCVVYYLRGLMKRKLVNGNVSRSMSGVSQRDAPAMYLIVTFHCILLIDEERAGVQFRELCKLIQ